MYMKIEVSERVRAQLTASQIVEIINEAMPIEDYKVTHIKQWKLTRPHHSCIRMVHRADSLGDNTIVDSMTVKLIETLVIEPE